MRSSHCKTHPGRNLKPMPGCVTSRCASENLNPCLGCVTLRQLKPPKMLCSKGGCHVLRGIPVYKPTITQNFLISNHHGTAGAGLLCKDSSSSSRRCVSITGLCGILLFISSFLMHGTFLCATGVFWGMWTSSFCQDFCLLVWRSPVGGPVQVLKGQATGSELVVCSGSRLSRRQQRVRWTLHV